MLVKPFVLAAGFGAKKPKPVPEAILEAVAKGEANASAEFADVGCFAKIEGAVPAEAPFVVGFDANGLVEGAVDVAFAVGFGANGLLEGVVPVAVPLVAKGLPNGEGLFSAASFAAFEKLNGLDCSFAGSSALATGAWAGPDGLPKVEGFPKPEVADGCPKLDLPENKLGCTGPPDEVLVSCSFGLKGLAKGLKGFAGCGW